MVPRRLVFALAGVVLVSVAALANGSSPQTVANTFGDGFWDLTAFTLQMAMVVLTGYVVATRPPVARLIDRIALHAPTPARRGELRCVPVVSVSFLNWGLSLVFSGLLARAIARRERPAGGLSRARRRGLHGAGRRVGARACPPRPRSCRRPPASLPPALLEDHRRSRLRHHDLHLAVAAHGCAILIALTRVDRVGLRTAGRRDPDRRGHGRRPGRRTERAVPPRCRRASGSSTAASCPSWSAC